jgi:hypothetical protein
VNKTLIALISAAFLSIGVANATTPAPAKPAAAKCDPKKDKNCKEEVKAAAPAAAAPAAAAPAAPAAAAAPAAPKKP